MDNLDFNYFCKSCPHDSDYRRANCFVEYRVKQFAKGDHIYYRGEATTRLSMLVKGAVDTNIVLASGHLYTSRRHHAPYPFGVLALFAEDNRYRADFVAVEDCTVIEVARERVEQQMVACRIFMRNFIAHNTTRFDLFSSHLAVLTHKSLKARIAFYILTKMQSDNQFSLGMTLESLSTYLCAERPSLSRAIAQLEHAGLIAYNRGHGQVLDIEALKRIVE